MRIFMMLFFTIFSTNIKAEIISRSVEGKDIIFINGEIEKGDFEKIVNLPIEWKETLVLLNSNGGSAADATAISAFLVTKGVITYVLPDHKCLTECALIWLSGGIKMLSNSASIGFGNSSYELTDEEKKIYGPMFLGEDFHPGISGIGFIVVGMLLQKGLGLNLEFILEFLNSSDTGPRYLSQSHFEKYNIEVLFVNDESGAFRDALKYYGVLSD
jgi:hypothetical protein